MDLAPDETQFLQDARLFLEHPGLMIRAANLLGQPLEAGLKFVPQRFREKIHATVQASLERGLRTVARTIPSEQKSFATARQESRKHGFFHTAAAFGTGAIGGFLGAASLPIELPLTTVIMLRSIACIARDFGHDVSDPETQLECLYVLSLGGSSIVTESAYWSSRMAFTDLIRHAAREIEKSSSPFLVRFLAQVASRFEIVVSEKAVAELIPIVGAIGGGAVNAAFSEHFNQAARFHFGIRALEIKYGTDQVRAAYLS